MPKNAAKDKARINELIQRLVDKGVLAEDPDLTDHPGLSLPAYRGLLSGLSSMERKYPALFRRPVSISVLFDDNAPAFHAEYEAAKQTISMNLASSVFAAGMDLEGTQLWEGYFSGRHEAKHHAQAQLTPEGWQHLWDVLRDNGVDPFPYRDDKAHEVVINELEPDGHRGHLELGAQAVENPYPESTYEVAYHRALESLFGPQVTDRPGDTYLKDPSDTDHSETYPRSSINGINPYIPILHGPGVVTYVATAGGSLYRFHDGVGIDVTKSVSKGQVDHIDNFYVEDLILYPGVPIQSRRYETGLPFDPTPISAFECVHDIGADTQTPLVAEVELALYKVRKNSGELLHETGVYVGSNDFKSTLPLSKIMQDYPYFQYAIVPAHGGVHQYEPSGRHTFRASNPRRNFVRDEDLSKCFPFALQKEGAMMFEAPPLDTHQLQQVESPLDQYLSEAMTRSRNTIELYQSLASATKDSSIGL